MAYILCVLNGLKGWFDFWTSPALWGTIIALAFLFMAVAAATAPAPGVGEAVLGVGAVLLGTVLIVAGVMFLFALLSAIGSCLVGAPAGGIGGGAAPGVVQAALAAGVNTCQQAQDLLAQTRAGLAAAQAAYDAALAASNQANRRLRDGRTALAAALAAVVAAIWNPLLLPAALAAVVAAGFLVARRAAKAAKATARLAQEAANLLRALADEAAAEALVASLCGAAASGAGVLTGPVPTFGLGASAG